MKILKKILAVFAAAISVFSVVACSENGNAGGTESVGSTDKMIITATSPSDGKNVCIANKTVKEIYVDYFVGFLVSKKWEAVQIRVGRFIYTLSC